MLIPFDAITQTILLQRCELALALGLLFMVVTELAHGSNPTFSMTQGIHTAEIKVPLVQVAVSINCTQLFLQTKSE